MKKLFLLWAAFLLSLAPAKADYQVLDKTKVATSYTTTVVDENNCEWTYITNAEEFMKLVSECQSSNVEEKHIRLACDIEYPRPNSGGWLNYVNDYSYFIKYFRGKFDGMGCTIKNFNLTTGNSTTADAAFIQELKGENSEVCNILFETPDVHGIQSTVALVVNKVTSTNASIYNIFVNGGFVKSVKSTAGGIVHTIKNGTTVSYCSLIGTTIYGYSENSDTSGMICFGLNDGSTGDICLITNCLIASMSPVDKNSFFSNPSAYNSYRGGDCLIVNNDGYIGIKEVSADNLKSGNNVLGNGWKYTIDAMPEPEGLYYWNPNNSYDLNVGTYGSSQTLTGQVKPLDYGRFIDVTPLKLTDINYEVNTSYVINDYFTNEIGVKNPITVLAEDVFQDKAMTTLQLPGGVTTVEGSTFHHGVTQAFVSNGNWHFSDNLLYLNTSSFKRLMTAVGDNTELTINGYYCTEIADEALLSQSNLKRLYINTWFPSDATSYPPITLLGENVFTKNCYESQLSVYVKDGTGSVTEDQDRLVVTESKILGDFPDSGYLEMYNKWDKFYSDNEDSENRLLPYYPVTRNPSGLSTLYLGYPVKLPSDCWAWVATEMGEGELTFKRVSGKVVPALCAVLLTYEVKDGSIMHLTPYLDKPAPATTLYEGNILKGNIKLNGEPIDPSENESNFYTLSREKGSTDWGTVAFRPFHPDDYILPSFVAYFSNQDVQLAKLSMLFDGDYELPDTDGIRDVAEQENSPSAPVYNLSGQRVGGSYRGLIIKNGRKYIAK